jgi:precorrin-6Y C5,15-methyltransferase (decarboxylating)
MDSIPDKIHIIGVGSDGTVGLTQRARDLLTAAELVLGSDYALGLLPDLRCEKFAIGADLTPAVRLLEANLGRRRMAVVASGDPLFYGVARYLCERLGRDHFEVLPHVSSMQLAFARVKESWEEAYLTNLATHPLDEIIDRIRIAETVGLFTTKETSPPAIARRLLAEGIDYFRAYVCENLGTPNESVTAGELAEVATMEFAPLNVMILRRKPKQPGKERRAQQWRRFGNPADLFAQSQHKSGLITQGEVRAISLAWLDLQPSSIVWDVGAGSGSVAIEAAQLAEQGTVYAIEQDVTDYQLLRVNLDSFGIKNVQAIHGAAPAVFAGLPAPDAIFVGGTGKEVGRLLQTAFAALRPHGRMVVNVATLEALNAAYATLKGLTRDVEVLLAQLARGVPQLESLRFESANPTFLLRIAKGN